MGLGCRVCLSAQPLPVALLPTHLPSHCGTPCPSRGASGPQSANKAAAFSVANGLWVTYLFLEQPRAEAAGPEDFTRSRGMTPRSSDSAGQSNNPAKPHSNLSRWKQTLGRGNSKVCAGKPRCRSSPAVVGSPPCKGDPCRVLCLARIAHGWQELPPLRKTEQQSLGQLQWVRAGSSKPGCRASAPPSPCGAGKGKRDAARSSSGARAGTVVIGSRSRRCPRQPACIKPVVTRTDDRNVPTCMSTCAMGTCKGGNQPRQEQGDQQLGTTCTPRQVPALRSQEAARYWWK